MTDDLLSKLKDHLGRSLSHFEDELKKIRSGRANAGLLDGVSVEVYGQKTPLPHVARVLASDARTLTITPYDPSSIEAISKAIRDDQTLGLNPMDDGKVVRVPIPEMTTERRDQIVKQVQAKAEDCRIALRGARHDALEAAKRAQKDRSISEDDAKRFDQAVGKELESASARVDELARAKEQEIMTV